MASVVLNYVQNFWPFSYFKFDDLRVSDALVKKLQIPETTKRFVYAAREPESGAVIYVLCVQNLSERSALDAECLIRTVKPDAVVAQVGPSISGNDFHMDEIASEDSSSFRSNYNLGGKDTRVDEYPMPTSSYEVIKKCFIHKINKEKYENVAGNLVLKEIFGIGFNGHFLSAKKAAEDVGASFLLVDSPFTKKNGDGTCSLEMKQQVEGEELGNKFHALQPISLFTQRRTSTTSVSLWRYSALNDVQSQMVKSLTIQWIDSASLQKVDSDNFQARNDYEAPQFSQAFYPLLVDLHDVFIDTAPYMGRALAHAQKMLCDINKGEAVDTKLLSEVYVFRVAVEGLRIALNYASRIPLKKLGDLPSNCEFSELPIQEKSSALVAHAVRSQTSRFKSIVALVDANGLAGLRKHWNTPIPMEVKDMVDQLVTSGENNRGVQNDGGRKLFLSEKPIVAVGAGVTAVLGASSLSNVVPASTVVKILTLKIPASLKLVIIQTNKIFGLAFGKSFAPSTVAYPGVASGVKTSIFKAAASANKFRAVAHSIIASAEKTSISAMRTAFYEIMRRRHVRSIGFLPWATFGFSIATCAGLLVYGDGIECAVESVPAAHSIASLGRGIQNLHQASQAIRQDESSRIQKSIESLLHRFRQSKVQ